VVATAEIVLDRTVPDMPAYLGTGMRKGISGYATTDAIVLTEG